MDNLMNFAFNVFWQTALITIIGFVLLKVCHKWSAPKRSLLASSILIALVLLPALICVFMYTNIKTIEPDSLNVPEFHYNIEDIMSVNTPVIDKSPQVKKYEIPAEKPFEFAIPMPTISEMMTILAGIWAVGIIFMLGKLLYGLIFLSGFRFGLTLVRDEKINQAMKTALSVFNVSKLPEIYISPKVESPITIGLFKPIMILPESLYSNLDENEIKSIILHEFSHIYHYDHLMGFVKRIAIAINWYNPLAYKISAKHSIAREEISDNYVLLQLKPKVYSECLVGLAEKTCLISNLPATVGMADKHISLEQRIKNILSNKRKTEIKTGKSIKGIIFSSICLAIIFIGGIQYTFAHNPKEKKKEEMDLRALHKLTRKGGKLSFDEAEKLERKVSKNPNDLQAVTELLGYYFLKEYKAKYKEIKKKKAKIILFLIKNHPENIIWTTPYANIYHFLNESKVSIKLWEAHIKKQPKNIKILWNASNYLLLVDKELAEKYLKKGQSIEPENTRWSKQLGLLYSFATRQADPKSALKSYAEYKKVYAQTKINKLYTILPRLGKAAYLAEKYKEADKYAKEMLWRGENTVDVQDKAIFMYNGTYLLGLLALQNGETEEACKYLFEAGGIQSLSKRSFSGPDMTLAYLLFLKNKHECVTEYLKLCSKCLNKNDYKQWSADVKIGLMPNFRYLYYVRHYGKVLLNIYSLRCYKLLDFGKKISAKKAEVLEKVIASTPEKKTYKIKDDITKLLGYYFQKDLNDKNIRAKRRKLIFRLIKNRPVSRVLALPEGHVSSAKKDEELISLWKAQIKKRPKAKYILANAASQLSQHDKKLAEQCLKKCQKIEPKEFLKLYNQCQKEKGKKKIIKKEDKKEIDTRAFWKLSVKGRKISLGEVKKLERKVSENPDDLNAAIELLAYYSSKQYKDKEIKKKRSKLVLKLIENHPESIIFKWSHGQIDPFEDGSKMAIKLWEDHIKKQPGNLKILWNASCNLLHNDWKLAEKYLKKGQSLAPENPRWAKQLGFLYSLPTRRSNSRNALKSYKQYKLAYSETKIKNSDNMLLNLTISALEAGKLKDAEKYANEMLRQAKEPGKRSWNYWTLSYYANFTLGMVALKREKIEDACKYLLAAGNAPGSPFPGSEPYMLLADELLEKGKRECVIKFLKSCSRFWKKDVCSNWIKKIESGATPELDKDKWLRRKIEKKYQNQPLK